MEEKKMPTCFLVGLKTPELNQEEQDIATCLSLRTREYKEKIWDIFWVNVIKQEMISEAMRKTITEIVGENNIVELDDKYIITLPVSLEEYMDNKEKTDMYKNKLREIFAKEDRIMYMPKH